LLVAGLIIVPPRMRLAGAARGVRHL